MQNFTETQYTDACKRIEILLSLVDNDTPAANSNFQELVQLSNRVADYEESLMIQPPAFQQLIISKQGMG